MQPAFLFVAAFPMASHENKAPGGAAAAPAAPASEADPVHSIVDPWKTLKPGAGPEERFAAYSSRLSKNHPLYTIESREVGKAPVGAKVVVEPPKFGKKGGFSTTFTGGNFQFSGLDCAPTKHRFLKELDG